MTNYELITKICELMKDKENIDYDVEIKEKATGKTGIARRHPRLEEIGLWYGEEDGSDDKDVDEDTINKEFEITGLVIWNPNYKEFSKEEAEELVKKSSSN